MNMNVWFSILLITLSHYRVLMPSEVAVMLDIVWCCIIAYFVMKEHTWSRASMPLRHIIIILLFYPTMLVYAGILTWGNRKSKTMGIISIINYVYFPVINACIIMLLYNSPNRKYRKYCTSVINNPYKKQSLSIFHRYITQQRTISTLSSINCDNKGETKFESSFTYPITALQYGLLHCNRSTMAVLYINEIASNIVISLNGIQTMLSSLINKKTKSSLAQDIIKSMGFEQSPTSSVYYNQNGGNCNEIYYIRFIYVPSTDSIVLSIFNDYKKPYNSDQISSTLKEITSCSLFHELINLVNGIYTNVELLNEETDRSYDNVDSYKSAIMFINVLTLRLRDIDDFTSISFSKFKLHYSQFQLYSLLIKYKEIISNFAKIKGSQVNISINKEVPTYITSDQSRILQVIVNCAYAILEKVEFCSLYTEAKMVAHDYIDIIIRLTTNEKNKIEAMFNSINTYQIPQCDTNSSIKNIEGLPLISTFYISKKLGKGIEVKKSAKNIFEMHVYIKNGFTDNSIENSFMQDDCPNPKSAKSKARQLQMRHLKKASSSVEFLLQYSQARNQNKLNINKKNDDIASSSELIIPTERESNEIKQVLHIPPMRFKDVLSIAMPSMCKYVRRSRRHTHFHNKASSTLIHYDDNEYSGIIADDNFVNIMVLKSLLKLIKVNVMCTKDGLDCVNAVKQLVLKGQFYKIKIIFMDMQMPIMDGIEATKEILRFLNANNVKRPPIIGVSSDNNEEDRNKFFAAGISEFVRKPISKSVVSDIYSKHVQFS